MHYDLYAIPYVGTLLVVFLIQCFIDLQIFKRKGQLEIPINSIYLKKEVYVEAVKALMTVFLYFYIAYYAKEVKWNYMVCEGLIGALAGKICFTIAIRCAFKGEFGIYQNAVVSGFGSKTFHSIKYYLIQPQKNDINYDCKMIIYSKYHLLSRPNYLCFNHKQRPRIEKTMQNHGISSAFVKRKDK